MMALRSVCFFIVVALVTISVPLVLITFSMMLYYCPLEHELAPTEGFALSVNDILLRPTATESSVQTFNQRHLEQYLHEDDDYFDIPKVIYQTYQHKDKIPPKVAENFAKYAIGYQRYIFDDNECLQFLKTYYHPVVTKTFHLLGGD